MKEIALVVADIDKDYNLYKVLCCLDFVQPIIESYTFRES
jgi:hypothetical protein